MGLVHEYEFKPIRVEFQDSFPGHNALYTCDRDVCVTTGSIRCHFDFDALRRICIYTMTSSLLNKLLAMGEDQRLIGIFVSTFNTVNKLGEDDLKQSVDILSK
jgi:hypothetical protein